MLRTDHSLPVCIFGLFVTLSGGPVLAEEPAIPSAQFCVLDQDQDGRLNYHEALAQAGEARILRHWLFFESDGNDDDHLTELEYITGSVSRPLPVARDFMRRDVDRDGLLSADEFLQWSMGSARDIAKRNFTLVDFNGNGTLDLAEFQALPGRALADRGPVPDPVHDRAQQTIQTWSLLVPRADTNADGRLVVDEWPAETLADWGPLGRLPLTVWDLNQDQAVTLAEGVQVIEMAFGLRRRDGEIVRLPTGQQVDLLAMKTLDRDGDGQLARDEFLKHYWTPDKSAEHFQALDADGDGIATLAEIRGNPLLTTDLVGYFATWDSSLNGKIDPAELAAHRAPWHRSIPQKLIPAFDHDGDGELSFLEFRQTPLGNSVTDWYYPRADADQDGFLSFAEFYQEPAPFLIGLSSDVFQRLDRNQDQRLSPEELEFTLDSLRAPAEQVFLLRDRDHDQKVSVDELWNETLPAATDAAAQRQSAARKAHAAKLVQTGDRDGDGQLDRDEFASVEAARQMEVFRDFLQRDLDRDGRLSREEYVRPNIGGKWEEAARAESVLFDLNDDEFLSLEEFQICPCTDPRPRHRFAGLDVNQDGQLSLREAMHIVAVADQPLARLHHFRKDYDGDGGVSREEWLTEGRPAPWGSEFRGRDFDDDDRLSLDEFLIIYGEVHRSEATRNFRFGDFDRDGFLTRAEFSHVPGSNVPAQERGPIPDPVQDLAGERIAAWKALFSKADQDQNGRLTMTEWPGAELKAWGPLGAVPFATWDVNQDQGVTREEGILQIDVAYGIRRPDGELIRLSSGLVVDWMTGRRLDADHDGTISRDEFTAGYWMGPEKSLPVFQQMDQDGDSVATIEEIRNSRVLTNDVVGQFLWFDADQNGELSEAEFLAKAAPWQQSLGTRLIAAFDTDGNKELSLMEFRQTPIPNPVSDWYYHRFDSDSDGLLSFSDFYRETAPELIGLYAAIFDRLDQDHSGLLSYAELEFQADWTKVNPQVRFAAADRNRDGRISLEEVFTKVPPAESTARIRHDRLQAYHAAWLARGDGNGDGTLSPEEYAACVDDLLSNLFESFVNLDVDGDDRLTYAEYIQPALGSASEAHAIAEAPLFDVNDDQSLSWKEFQISPRANPTPAQRFVGLDANSDGLVTEEEFLHTIPAERRHEGLRGFCHIDTDGDGSSDRAEWMRQGSGPRALLSHFRWRDLDRDGKLTLDEYIEPAGDEWKRHVTRDFRLIDRDGDRLLTLDEFQSAPGMASLAERGPLADTVADWLEDRLQKVLEHYRRADSDQDNRVSLRQWPDLSSVSPDLAAISVRTWDQNRDGAVTPEECRTVLELAYGFRTPNGKVIRFPNGRIVNVAMIRQFDTDRNLVLSSSEFIPKFWQGPAKSRELFQKYDANGDGRWDWDEQIANPETTADIFGQFCWYDTDLDGFIDQSELDARMADWQKSIGSRLIRSFCSSGDGRMSFQDFRATPFANPMTDWFTPRTDRDYDAKLSWAEFYNEDSPPYLVLLYREYFNRFDLNQDGLLTYDELEFNVDLDKVSHDVSFRMLDKNRDDRLELLEIFPEPKPSGTDQDAQERYGMRLAAAESRFLADDTNRDGGLDLQEYIKSREAALKAVERKTNALSRHRGKKPSNLPFIAFVVLDVLVILGAAWFVWKKTGKGQS